MTIPESVYIYIHCRFPTAVLNNLKVYMCTYEISALPTPFDYTVDVGHLPTVKNDVYQK